MSRKKITMKILEMIMYKYPLINALTLLMLIAERAYTERESPINPRIIYANLIGFLACGLLMSSHIRQKEAALVFSGQLFYFAHTFYNNQNLHYKQWLRLQMSTRQIGCAGCYLMFAYILAGKKSKLLSRAAEVFIGLYFFSYAYLINNVKEIRSAVLDHVMGGDWGRYLFTVAILACALSFLSGYFLRDMSLCAALTIITLTVLVDCDFNFWTKKKGVHLWNQIRMVSDNACVSLGLFYAYFHVDNRVKID